MPARPLVLDELGSKLQEVTASSLVTPRCYFRRCGVAAEVFLTLDYADGHVELYGLCRRDAELLRQQNPLSFPMPAEQSMFTLRGK